MSSLTSKDERATAAGTDPQIPHPEGAQISQASGSQIPHPAREEIEVAAVLHALSDPVRLSVVRTLADGRERTCNSLELPVSKSTCTHHFRVLREAGVLRQRVDGTTKLNSLRREDLEARCPGLIDAVLGAAPAS